MSIVNGIRSLFGRPARRPFPPAPLDAGDGRKVWEKAAAIVNARSEGYVPGSQVKIPGLAQALYKTAFADGQLSEEERKVFRRLLFTGNDAGPIHGSVSQTDGLVLYGMTSVDPALGSLALKMAETGEPLTTQDVLQGVKDMVGKADSGGDFRELGLSVARFSKPVSEETAAYLEAATYDHFGREFEGSKGGHVQVAPHWSDNPYYQEAADAIDAIRGVKPPPAKPADTKRFLKIVQGLREEIQYYLQEIYEGNVLEFRDIEPASWPANQRVSFGSLEGAYFTHVPREVYNLFGRALSLANRSFGCNPELGLTYVVEDHPQAWARENLKKALELLNEAERAVSTSK